MLDIVKSILKSLGPGLGKTIQSLINVCIQIFGFLNKREDRKQLEKTQKDQTKYEKKVDGVCNKGTLDDLFDLKGCK